GGNKTLGNPPNNATSDWVILVTKSGSGGGGNPVPPTVSLTAPANNATYTVGANVSLTATAADSDGSIAKVEFFRGNTLIGTDTNAPFTATWTNAAAGTFALTAKATDNDGLSTISTVVTIVVNAVNVPVPPTVSITAPGNNATFTVGANVAIAASAADADGTVSKVEFFRDNILIATATGLPYVATWTNATPGTFALTAKATDNSGLSTTSAAVSITVNAAGGGGTGGGTSCPAPFEEQNGIVVIEAESVPAVGDWTLKSAIPGYTGSGYYVWDGPDYFNNPGNGILEYKVNITTTGTYLFTWRNVITVGTSTSDFNDNWLRFPDATDSWGEKGGNKVYPKGSGKTPNPAGTSADNWFKVYVSQMGWSWQTRTSDGNPHQIYAQFDTPGIYTIQISARSNGHGIDRLVMTHTTVNTATSQDLNQAETLCQGGGSTPVAPQVSLTAPLGGATFTAGATINLTATASDADGTVTKVDFYQGGLTLLGSDNTSPYAFNWLNVPAGTYTITAKATDNDGLTSVSSPVTITVLPASNQAPTVTLTSPQNGASFNVGANVPMTATAADADGNVVKVEFWEGTNLLGSDNNAPYAFTWNSPPAGTYSIKAVAIDNANLSTSSSAATIKVVGTQSPPTVVITSPANNANFTVGDNVSINASASDTDGTVTKVEFYASNMLLGADTGAPYGVTWTNVPAGTFLLTAVATDNQGLQTTSAQVVIVVDANSGGGGGSGGLKKPVVTLTKPLDGATFNPGDQVLVNATATDADGTITEVKFYLNGVHYATQKVAAYNANLKNVQAGVYQLMAIGFDNDGLSDTSIVNYTVGSGGGSGGGTTGKPVVEIIDPLDGSNFNPGDNVSVEATATDADGAITKVDFYLNGVKWRTEKVAPYTGSINNVQPGQYQLMAIGYDNDGKTDTSIVTYTVGGSTGGGATPPVVEIITPVDGAVYKAGSDIAIEAIASDPDGSIVKVEFYLDNTLLKTEKSAPYEADWTNAQPGTYFLRAIAYDNDGLTTGSAKITVVISGTTPYVNGVEFEAFPDQGVVILSWSAMEEYLVETYRLSVSVDSLIFEDLAEVQAVGTSSTKTSYDEVDLEPKSDVIWYKLEAIGTDGSILSTNIVKVDLSEPKVLEQWIIYPNPLSGNQPINIWALLTQDEDVTIEVVDVFSKPVFGGTFSFYTGQNKLTIGLQTLSPGMYFFTLRLTQTGEVLDTKVFIKTP
ncbi:MAG: Ig-like domain-containing protein, partial [Bacteroidia bacterium]|nr:Ig-like domain-containing protein [Bacteroidia bacterium]